LLTYGHAQAAANDALLYGFCIPAGLGVMLWIFARLSQAELPAARAGRRREPLASRRVHRHSSGFCSATAPALPGWNFRARRRCCCSPRSCSSPFPPSPRSASAQGTRTVSVALVFARRAAVVPVDLFDGQSFPRHAWPVRGVVQAVINWWFANNLVFVWLALVGIGTAFYFLPKIAGRPLHSRLRAVRVLDADFFGTWCGIPQGAPVPAWLPTLSASPRADLVPLLAIAVIAFKTVCGANTVPAKAGRSASSNSAWRLSSCPA
jgi:cytochrome c oxidase cbb3-type subunit 1